MQSVLLIPHPQLVHDAISQILAKRFALCQSTMDIAVARAMLTPKQLVVLSLADIHEHERMYFLRELVLEDYPVIVLLPGQHKPLQRASALLGAFGMVETDSDRELLTRQINIVLSGQRTYQPEFLSEALDFYYQNLPPLSRSSMIVLSAFLKHPKAKNGEIGKLVSLSEGRVSNLFSTLYRKFKVRARFELADVAKAQGYFIGLNLIFPQGFNMHANEIKIVDGEAKYRLTS